MQQADLKLLVEVKNELGITWDKPATNDRIFNIISDCKADLNEIAGKKLDFSCPGIARRLLFNYCRYEYSNSGAQFKVDYSEELTQLNISSRIEERRQKNADS